MKIGLKVIDFYLRAKGLEVQIFILRVRKAREETCFCFFYSAGVKIADFCVSLYEL